MRISRVYFSVAAALLIFVMRSEARAQSITIAPMAGAYTSANDFKTLRSQADTLRLKRESKLALGFNVDLGFIRGSVAYVSGATLTEKGATNTTNVGNGSLLAAAADLVLRPIPRILVQPYLFGGAGLKHSGYSYNANGISNAFPQDASDFTLHAGVGADMMLGHFGVVAEVSDFISKNGTAGSDFSKHDAFGMVGLKVKL
jgi:hypothetical protein